MEKPPVVVIFRERNDVCVTGINLDQYPTGDIPKVGDLIALHAERTFFGGATGTEEVKVTYHNGLVEVLEVWAGKGDLLHPTSGCPFYQFTSELEGYGIRVSFEDTPLPKGVKPVEAQVIFGL